MSFFNKEVKKMESESKSNVVEEPLFSLGIQRTSNHFRTQKYKEKKRIIRKKKTKKHNRSTKHPDWFLKYFKKITEQNMFFSLPQFNLFSSFFSNEEQTILSSCISSVEQQEWLRQSWSNPPFGKAEDWTDSQFWSLEKVERIKQAIFKTNNFRGVLRRFLRIWRISRFQKVNDEDLFTCEVPKYPVHIIDWHSKSIWVFEAQSMMRDITNRLLHHDGCFEDPLPPRNPYTNLPLTTSQTISVWSQLMRSSASFPFTAYRASRMNLTSFRYEHRIYLAIHALRKTFEDITFYETKEKILDFIEIAFDRQGIDMNINEYAFVLNHFPQSEQLHKWKHFCEKYHEIEIKYANFDTARIKAQDKIFVQAFPLLHKRHEIKQIVREHQPEQNPFLLDILPTPNTNIEQFMEELISSLQFQNQN